MKLHLKASIWSETATPWSSSLSCWKAMIMPFTMQKYHIVKPISMLLQLNFRVLNIQLNSLSLNVMTHKCNKVTILKILMQEAEKNSSIIRHLKFRGKNRNVSLHVKHFLSKEFPISASIISRCRRIPTFYKICP